MKYLLPMLLLATTSPRQGNAGVVIEDVPERGLQPEVAVAPDGTAHLVYLVGEARAAEVRYTSRTAGANWRAPVTVNSSPGSAIAIGTIRGPQVALGANGAVHVLWNGSGGGHDVSAPLWYARRMAGDEKFAAQRNLLADTTALDGGSSITTDGKGMVHAVWHGMAVDGKPGEENRQVFMRSSGDQGSTFAAPLPLTRRQPGVCACCSLRALSGPDGLLRVFYRSAVTRDQRNMTLAVGEGATLSLREIEAWKTGTCPMSSSALAMRNADCVGTWETAGQIRVGWLSRPTATAVAVATRDAKHPALAINASGEMLVAWVEGSGWNRGGSVAWSKLDASLQSVEQRQEAGRVPAWGRATVYANPGGDFVILR